MHHFMTSSTDLLRDPGPATVCQHRPFARLPHDDCQRPTPRTFASTFAAQDATRSNWDHATPAVAGPVWSHSSAASPSSRKSGRPSYEPGTTRSDRQQTTVTTGHKAVALSNGITYACRIQIDMHTNSFRLRFRVGTTQAPKVADDTRRPDGCSHRAFIHFRRPPQASPFPPCPSASHAPSLSACSCARRASSLPR